MEGDPRMTLEPSPTSGVLWVADVVEDDVQLLIGAVWCGLACWLTSPVATLSAATRLVVPLRL